MIWGIFVDGGCCVNSIYIHRSLSKKKERKREGRKEDIGSIHLQRAVVQHSAGTDSFNTI